ncbi:MAG TPA: flavin reductase family protein [Acidimicrobiales bacterium]|jgi:3-hydroxy-9,10-secoandrosta-1,3,5(10)-triene-9,17-dione monooxygenase reductase component
MSDFDLAGSASDETTDSPRDEAADRAGGSGARPDPLITPEHYRATLGHFCTGITIVTAHGEGGPAGLTCQSFSALSLDPPLVLVCPAKSSTSWPSIEAAGAFCINVLADDQEELCRGFATRGGEKFSGVGWSPAPFTGSPIIAGALAWIECRLEVLHDAGDHLIAVGRVLDLKAREGRPLLFFRGGYGRFDV